jgi:ferredoxin-NADP reductase
MPETEVSASTAPRRLQWQTAEVAAIVDETPRVKSLVLNLREWPGHRAGQHVDVRLTAEDGYRAQRSYSIASAPEDSRVTLTVEQIEDGEVSPYLTQDVQIGDKFELRGPIGGYFVWTAAMEGPLFLVAGGSGVVPLMAMLRHRAATKSEVPATLLYSSRTYDDIIYREELDRLAMQSRNLTVVHTLTRKQPPGWSGFTRRIDAGMLERTGFPAGDKPHAFICGPTPFVETAARALHDLGHAPNMIKTERFGPTGG